MRHCLKKPLVVDAVQVDEPFFVDTIEGRMHGHAGDYLMRGTSGELFVCARAIFEASYDFFPV